jgi:hypothetical protein
MNATRHFRWGSIFPLTVTLLAGFNLLAATGTRPTLRINTAALPLLATNRITPKVTAAVTNQGVSVKVPSNSTLLVRRGGKFVSAPPGALQGTNRIYQLRPNDVYVARSAPSAPVALTTNGMRLPDPVRAVVGGQQIEGHIEVALQSELMVYRPETRRYEGMLDICFRSAASDEVARNLLPLYLRIYTTAGLQLATNAVVLTNVGNAGCQAVSMQCSSARESKVTVKSDASGDQEFMVNFDVASWVERFKDALIILGGIALGAMGGWVRSWQSRHTKHAWKKVAGGAFCGLILVLLGQVGVQQFFKIEGPVGTSVLLGFCGVLGYLGVRMFEHFAPKN